MVQATHQNDVTLLTKKHTYGTWRAQKSWTPKQIVDAEKCFFPDAAGNRFLDFSSQLICSNLRHGNKAVIAAICHQTKKLPYVVPPFTTEARAKLGTYVLSWLNYLLVAPPLIASSAEIDQGISALDQSLRVADMEIS